MSKVSAIIVNYNAGQVLNDTVKSLLCSPYITNITVVDNDSRDNSMRNIEELAYADSRIVCIRNNKNLGFAKACNIGIAGDGESDYLFFVNPDCIVDENAVSKLLSCLKSSPEVGMAGPLLLNPDGTEQAGGRRSIPTPWLSFVRAFGLSKLGKRYAGIFSDFLLHKQPLPESPIEIEAISGSCMLVRCEALMDVGFLDAGYFLHCEDLDWCIRFRLKDWKIMFVPDAHVIHYKGVCSKTRPIFVEWHKHKGMTRFYGKFFRHRYPGLLLWIIAAAVWFRFVSITFYYGLRHLKQLVKNDVT
jgi:GT2 family glycosyltransferase